MEYYIAIIQSLLGSTDVRENELKSEIKIWVW